MFNQLVERLQELGFNPYTFSNPDVEYHRLRIYTHDNKTDTTKIFLYTELEGTAPMASFTINDTTKLRLDSPTLGDLVKQVDDFFKE